MDALKGLMSTMADTITKQVTEQVHRALEMTGAGNPSNPLGHLMSRAGFPRQQELVSLRSYDHAREGVRSYKTNRLQDERQKDRPHLMSLVDPSVDAP